MKKTTLLLLAAIPFMGMLNAQNKALKLTFNAETLPCTVAHIEECENVAQYNSADPDTGMAVLSDEWTVEVWVKSIDITTHKILLSGGNTQFRLQAFDYQPDGWGGESDYKAIGLSTTGVNDSGEFDEVFGDDPAYLSESGEWTHYAIVNDGWSITLWVNGTSEYMLTNYQNTNEDYTSYDALAWAIGDNGTNWMTNAECEMDNYRVWTVARSSAQIAADMKKVTPTDVTGLLANYTFDNDVEGRITNTAGDTRHMVFNSDAMSEVSYVASTADIDPAALISNEVVAVSVYPNPVSDELRFTTNENFSGASVSVYNLTGQCVLSVSELNNNTLNVSDLSSGIYTVKVANDAKIFTANFVVE